MDYRRIKAIEAANKERILKLCPAASDNSGIYVFTREEDGFKYAYIGQSVKVLTRLAQHLTGYQRIDLSIKKHKLWSVNNPAGWKISEVIYYPEDILNKMEQDAIMRYAMMGYQLRNATSGSQGKGKKDISDNPTKGYLEGLHNGYAKAQKEIAHLFKLHLDCTTKNNPPTKLQEKAMAKFEEFIGRGEENVSDEKEIQEACR